VLGSDAFALFPGGLLHAQKNSKPAKRIDTVVFVRFIKLAFVEDQVVLSLVTKVAFPISGFEK